MTTAAAQPAQQTQPPDPEPIRVPLRDAPQARPIDPASFRATLEAVRARPDEMKWASIPWQTDLWEARRIAAEQEKPIFAWMMNGNPLGCV
jgi:hypothetical protein